MDGRIIHNHPNGGSDGRKWGGPFSEADLSHIARAYSQTGGRVKRIVATSREGTYSASVKRTVSQKQVRAAAQRADDAVTGKRFQSERAMWNAVNKAYTSEFAKIGIDITFAAQSKRSSKLVTRKIGNY